ncbi:hypothetical protein [Verminephrobacter eiseniae]|nr:hypothetical protein [Verminephrobacter eiseniae]
MLWQWRQATAERSRPEKVGAQAERRPLAGLGRAANPALARLA